MKAVVFAYHEVGARCLQALLDGGVDVQLVITHTDDPNERIWFTSVAELAAKAKAKGVNLHLPVDFVCGDKFAPDATISTATDAIPAGIMGLDAGPKTREMFAAVIAASKTIIWNGPPGVFEFEAFAEGTKSMAAAIAAATEAGATTVVGGGDTATAAKKFGVADKVTHCSTGGGASLEFLEGKVLPGVAALSEV
jgi:phosphoglycerate kinase